MAIFAGRAVGDGLAAAEAALAEKIVQRGRTVSDQMRKDLTFGATRQIGARRGGREIELRGVAGMLCHGLGFGSCP